MGPGMSSGSVLDVRPAPKPTYAMAPTMSSTRYPAPTPALGYSYTATPPEEPAPPLIMSRPAPARTASTATAAKPAPSHGSAKVRLASGGYKVKKGDTLFGIARNKYGDGKKWMQIASANPGLSPQTLKIGQTIVLP